MAFYRNQLFAAISNVFARFDNEGAYIGEVPGGPNNNVFSGAAGLLFLGTQNYEVNMFMHNGSAASMGQRFSGDAINAMRFHNSASFRAPVITTGQSISFVTSYLATINNLDVPVTKTSADTMKITYELTQGQ
jgi:hypothetical protein